jgi:hypothetical protein
MPIASLCAASSHSLSIDNAMLIPLKNRDGLDALLGLG